MSQPLLAIEQLNVAFGTDRGDLQAIRDLSLTVNPGEIVGVVGETGSGKSTCGLAILGLLAPNAKASGRIQLRGRDLLALPEGEMRKIRGGVIGYIPQDPMTSLDPTFSVGDQIAESVRAHQGVSRKRARALALELMNRVGIPEVEIRYGQARHLLSGGMRQRILIAIALANSPALILADEPTTALDVTLQAQILRQLAALRQELGTSIVLITHDLGVVAQVCDQVAVLYAGRLAEAGPVSSVLAAPQHPYTQALLRATPTAHSERGSLEVIPGEVPNMIDPPQGCAFAPRCSHRFEACDRDPPAPVPTLEHSASCWLTHPESEFKVAQTVAGAERSVSTRLLSDRAGTGG